MWFSCISTQLSFLSHKGAHFIENSWFQVISLQAFSDAPKSWRAPTAKNEKEKGQEIT
jgi:hypothetical protein